MKRSKVVFLFVALFVAVALSFGVVFRVSEVRAEGFVGPDTFGEFGEEDWYFSVYDLTTGFLLMNVFPDTNLVCPSPFGASLCHDTGDAGYFGDRPEKGDHVQVETYFFQYRWKDPERYRETFSLTFVEILPPVSHVQARPLGVTITIIVDGDLECTSSDFGNALECIVTEIEEEVDRK